MATLIEAGHVIDTDPSYVGRWSGEGVDAYNEPDRCYFCGIGDRPEAIGFITDNKSRYGVCEKHKSNDHPEGTKGHFVAYPDDKISLTTVEIKAKDVRRGMILLVSYPGFTPHVRKVTRIERTSKTTRRIHLTSLHFSTDVNATFTRALSRFD